jgi:hypothetical protein
MGPAKSDAQRLQHGPRSERTNHAANVEGKPQRRDLQKTARAAIFFTFSFSEKGWNLALFGNTSDTEHPFRNRKWLTYIRNDRIARQS